MGRLAAATTAILLSAYLRVSSGFLADNLSRSPASAPRPRVRGAQYRSSSPSSTPDPAHPRKTTTKKYKTATKSGNKKNGGRPKQQRQPRPRRNSNTINRSKPMYSQAAKRLNQQISRCENASCILEVLQKAESALTAPAGGGVLNDVNFSTSIHRLARHSTADNIARASILADPRFALLLAGLAEALADQKRFLFGARELSNICWAMAKLRLAPPASTMSLSSGNGTPDKLAASAAAVRKEILQASTPRHGAPHASVWTPTMSQTAGYILDHIGNLVLAQEMVDQRQRGNAQDYSNLLWAWATADRADPTVFGAVVLSMIRQQRVQNEKPLPQVWSNSVWAFATAHVYDGSEELLAFVAELMAKDPRFVDQYKLQNLSNTVWAIATLLSNQETPMTEQEGKSALAILRCCTNAMVRRASECNPQDLSNTIWGLATLGFGLNTNVVFTSRQQDVDRELMHTAVDAIVRAAIPQLRRFEPQAISNTVWALATAEVQVGEIDAFDTSLVPPGQRPQVRDPMTACFGIASEQLMQRPHAFDPQAITNILWSFSNVGIRHPTLFKSIAEHLIGLENDPSDTGRGLYEFSPQGLSNMAWAFAQQAQLAHGVSDRIKGSSTLSAHNTASHLDVGEVLIQRLFAAIAETDIRAHDQLKRLNPQELANTAWAFAVLGLRSDAFMEKANAQMTTRMTAYTRGEGSHMNRFKGQNIANLLWALATLNMSPSEDVLESITLYIRKVCADETGQVTSENITGFLNRQAMANIAWSCAVFGIYPPELIRVLYTGLFGETNGSASMTRVHDDSGLTSKGITTLIYVQIALDLEGAYSQGLTLPDDILDGWTQSNHIGGRQSTIDNGLSLNLSTSKIQRAVSAAFTRIGLEHVEEHVIAMQELVDYGVKVPPTPMEILSIDIANLSERIAVEVDGPTHFVSRLDSVTADGGYNKSGRKGDRKEINGSTALKQRLLQKLGWTTVNVPFWEWNAVEGNHKAEEDYCRALLKGVAD